MLRASDVSLEKLKKGGLGDELPELYELKKTTQNNKWHNNDSVFDHTLAVLENLEEDIKTASPVVRACLRQKVSDSTRKEILFLAALFHDIAKKEALAEEDGKTTFKGHEKLGSGKVKNVLDRFDLSEKEKSRVADIIENHDAIHKIFDPENKGVDEQLAGLRKRFPGIFTELVLLGMADTQGSHLKDNAPDEFEYRMRCYMETLAF